MGTLGEIDAAVGIDGLAGDEAALGEENRDTGNFIDRAEGTYGKAVGRESRKRSDHVGFDQARHHRVDRDAAGRKLQGQGLDGAYDTRLGSAVVHLSAIADNAGHRRYGNDAAALARTDHRHHQGLEHIVKTVQVRAQNGVPIVAGQGREGAVPG